MKNGPILFGVGNVLEIEQAMAGDDYASMRGRSIVPVLLEGLSGYVYRRRRGASWTSSTPTILIR